MVGIRKTGDNTKFFIQLLDKIKKTSRYLWYTLKIAAKSDTLFGIFHVYKLYHKCYSLKIACTD